MDRVHAFGITIDWNLISEISNIDRFDASWSIIEKKEGQTLKQLKSIATVRSVGASTRIEGSMMSDAEVEVLLQNIVIDKLEDRDSQEVVGYFEVFDLISESADSIRISENSLKNIHNQLLKYSSKDQWHKGDYKQHNNSVEASFPDGTTQIIFETTPPGVDTEDAMKALIDWYNRDSAIHPLVKCAIFTYEFLSIHPFQDGNGRLSRLVSTLILLKHGYKWIQYVSLEHEIEHRKNEYYAELRKCQAQRPGEDVSTWVLFFLSTLKNIQSQLTEKLTRTGIEAGLSPREKSILAFLSDHPGSKSGAIAARLNIPNPTVKRILKNLVNKNLIEVFSTGPGTNYSVK
jgi:Fic family protein